MPRGHAVDLSRPPGSRTHLGRLVEQLDREGPGELVDVVSRKLGMNLASWSSSPFRWMLPLVVLGLVGLWLVPGGRARTAWRRLDPSGAMALGFGALVVLGYALNDTGVLVPALMGAIALAIVVSIALEPLKAEGHDGEYGRAPVEGGRRVVREWPYRS